MAILIQKLKWPVFIYIEFNELSILAVRLLIMSSFIRRQMENFLETTSASAYWKNTKGVYIEVNKVFIRVSNMKSADEVVGRTDRDLMWQEQASILMKNDQEIIHTGKTKTIIEPVKSFDGTVKYYLSHKAPLKTQKGKIIGVFGLSFLIGGENSVLTTLNEMSTLVDPQTLNKINETKLTLNSSILAGLTKRQADCLYYLVYGMTIKEIAKTLDLAPKTVEHYLDAVKIKLNCYSRSELIAKALQLGVAK